MAERAELLKLYESSLDEYRFEVTLGWTRSQQMLVLNVAIVTAGFGLLRFEGGSLSRWISLVFLVGLGASLLGILVVWQGHKYYRQTILKKTFYEELLGYWNPLEGHHPAVGFLALATTEGQRSGKEILRDPEAWLRRPLRWPSVVLCTLALLGGLALLDLIGAAVATLG